MKYPCNHCGECSIWLAAYEVPELATHEQVVAACHKDDCPIVGTEVEENYEED